MLKGVCFASWLHIVEIYGIFWCLQTEMISDAIDDAIDDDEAEEETEELTNQVGLFNCFYLLYLVQKNCIPLSLCFLSDTIQWSCAIFRSFMVS